MKNITVYLILCVFIAIPGCTGSIAELAEPKEIRIDFLGVIPTDNISLYLEKKLLWNRSENGRYVRTLSAIAIPIHINITLTRNWHKMKVSVNDSEIAFPLQTRKTEVVIIWYDRKSEKLSHMVYHRPIFYY